MRCNDQLMSIFGRGTVISDVGADLVCLYRGLRAYSKALFGAFLFLLDSCLVLMLLLCVLLMVCVTLLPPRRISCK
jgi:hypothetical protein